MIKVPGYRRQIDTSLAVAIFGLSVFGLLMLYSASAELSRRSHGANDSTYYLVSQFIPFVFGLVLWVVLQQIDYHRYAKWKTFWMVATGILLLSVMVFSKGAINGAHRWVSIGGQSFQPSEFVKLTFIMFLACWFSESHKDIADWKRGFVPFMAVIFGISGFMLWQHDLGTLSVMLSVSLGMYLMSGARLGQVLALAGSMLGLGFLAIKIEPYRMQRIFAFLNADSSSQGAGYQIIQARISIGLGGWWGRGFLQGIQKKGFLPEAHTDSIFAVIVEELGFFRSILVVLVYAFIAVRGFRIAKYAPDHFGSLLAVGITIWFTSQALINMAAMVSLIPLTGVPLPFISYGRTAMIALLMATGILLNISRFSNES